MCNYTCKPARTYHLRHTTHSYTDNLPIQHYHNNNHKTTPHSNQIRPTNHNHGMQLPQISHTKQDSARQSSTCLHNNQKDGGNQTKS